MPTYDYRCKSCGHQFEAFEAMSAIPLKDCPVCKGQVERLIGGGNGLIFKGSGFYITDYKTSSGEKTSEPKTQTEKPSTSSGKAV